MGYKEEQAILNQQIEIPCPGGGRDQRCKMNDVIGRSNLRTQKGEYKFKSSDQYKAKDAMKKLIQRQEKFEKEIERMQQQQYHCQPKPPTARTKGSLFSANGTVQKNYDIQQIQ